MRQIIYFSTAVGPQTKGVLTEILSSSRRWNEQKEVTGLLIAGGYRYLQVVEAEHDALQLTIDRILRDRRHTRIDILVDRSIAERCFPDWSMAFCADPALDQYASFSDLAAVLREAVDSSLRAQVDKFEATFCTSSLKPPSPWTS